MDMNITRKPWMRPVSVFGGRLQWMCWTMDRAGYGATWEEAYSNWVER